MTIMRPGGCPLLHIQTFPLKLPGTQTILWKTRHTHTVSATLRCGWQMCIFTHTCNVRWMQVAISFLFVLYQVCKGVCPLFMYVSYCRVSCCIVGRRFMSYFIATCHWLTNTLYCRMCLFVLFPSIFNPPAKRVTLGGRLRTHSASEPILKCPGFTQSPLTQTTEGRAHTLECVIQTISGAVLSSEHGTHTDGHSQEAWPV